MADDNTGALENNFTFMLDHALVGFKILHPAVFSGIQIDDPVDLVNDELILLLLVHEPVMLIISSNHRLLHHLRNYVNSSAGVLRNIVSGGMKSR